MRSEPPDPLDLDAFLPYRLSVLANRTSRALARTYASKFDLTIPEWRVMAVLGQAPGLSADEVAARTQMDKVTVSRAVARLLDKDYVDRGISERDRRRSVLRLSRRGNGVYARIIPMARKFDREFCAGLSHADREGLFELLEKLDAAVASLNGG